MIYMTDETFDKLLFANYVWIEPGEQGMRIYRLLGIPIAYLGHIGNTFPSTIAEHFCVFRYEPNTDN